MPNGIFPTLQNAPHAEERRAARKGKRNMKTIVNLIWLVYFALIAAAIYAMAKLAGML